MMPPNVAALALFAMAYVLTGGLGHGLALVPGVSIIFWPPAGIFLAALLLAPLPTWPWWVAVACASELVCNALWFHNPISLALVYFSANALEALTGALLVRRFAPRPFRLETLEEAGWFVLLCAGVAPLVGAAVIATTDALIGKHRFFDAFGLVWLGDGSGLLISAPLTIFVVRGWGNRKHIPARRFNEAWVLLFALLAVTEFALLGLLPSIYVVLPLLLWAAARFQLQGAAVALAVVTLMLAGYGAERIGDAPTGPSLMHDRIVRLQTFLAVSAACALFVGSLSSQRERAMEALRASNRQLELRVAQRTAKLEQSERTLRLFVEHAPAAIAMLDREMRYLAASRRWVQDYNLPNDLVGHCHYDHFPQIGERWKQVHRRALGGTIERAEEESFRGSDGSELWLLWEVRPWLAADGSVGGIIIFTEDITHRKRAERAQRDGERRLRLALEASDTGLWTWDLNTDAVTWSPECYRIHGLAEGAFEGTGEAFFRLVHLDDRDRVEARVRSAVERDELYECEFRVVRPDGRIAWVANRGRAELDDAGELRGVIGTITDISARKLAEQAIAESELRFRTMADSTPVMIWVTDARGEIELVNRAYCDFFGITAAQVRPPGTWRVLLHPDDEEAYVAQYLAAIRERAPFHSETRVRAGDGTWRWLASYAVPRFSPDGDFVGYVGSSPDITDRKLAEKAQAESEARFRRAANAGRLLIYEVSLESAAMAEVYGLHHIVGEDAQDGLSSEWWHARIHPEDLPRHREYLQDCLQNPGCTSYVVRYRVRHADGSWRTVEDHATIERSGGVPRYLVGTISDISEQQQAAQRLREEDRKKDEFLATLAHELRNPLAPIMNSVILLDHIGSPDPLAVEARATIHRQMLHLVRLVDDLLDLSRITQGKIHLEYQRIDLRTCVRHALEVIETARREKKQTLRVDLPDEPLEIEADDARVTQIVGNLLTNACRYTPTGGEVSVTVRREEADAVVRVRDTGIGIPPDKLQDIFELFGQLQRPLEHTGGGLGIGLNLVRKLVDLHHGSITATSQGADKGSEFTLRLPAWSPQQANPSAVGVLVEAPGPPAVELANAKAEIQGGFRRILIADDNVDAAQSLAMLLQFSGYETKTAHDGLQAVELAREYQPDIVLLDIGMPKMNGYDACRAIRRELAGREPLMIAVTGWGQENDRRASSDAGFDQHLVKPIDFAKVQALLMDSVGNQ